VNKGVNANSSGGKASTANPGGDWIGSMQSEMEIYGDIIPPVVPPEEWDVLKADAQPFQDES
jgi:hypothetical protein